MHNYSNFNHNAASVFPSERLVEFDLIGGDEYEIELFNPYVVSPPLSTMRVSFKSI